MKRIILVVLVLFLCVISYSQNTNVQIPEQDTSLLYIADSLNSVGEDIKVIGQALQKDYDDLGFVGFVRVYRGFILTIIVFVVLSLLWFKSGNNTDVDDKK